MIWNKTDPYIWFYLKNFGIVFLFLIPAFFYAKKENKRLLISAVILFILAEIIIFQPNEYDNNKLFFVSYMKSSSARKWQMFLEIRIEYHPRILI